jgi:O-acetyl-ADP-ribose deacetylase (regulator of RNase III)
MELTTELTTELASASEAVRQIRDLQPRPGRADQEVNLTVQWATDAGAAYAAVTRLLAAARAAVVDAAGPLDELQPEVMAVAELLPAAQRLLPAADPATGALTQRLAAAVGRLTAAQPPWWPARAADLTTAGQARMIVGAMSSRDVTRQSLLAGITGVVTDVHQAVAHRAGLVAGRATAARGLLTGGDQRTLGDTLDDTIRRARAIERSQPPPATLAGVEAAARDLERLNDLQAAADRVIAEATAGLPQRLADAQDLTTAALALLPHTDTQRGNLEPRVVAAQAGVSALPAWPGSLAAAADVVAVANALTRLTDLENAARDVLVAATGPADLLLRLVADERRLALIVRPLRPHVGEPQRRDELIAAGNAAVGGLHEIVPQWWPQRATAVLSADLLREAGQLLDGGLLVRVRRAASELRRTADAMLRAAAGSRQEQLNRTAQLTADVRAELPHTGAAQAALTAAAGRAERAAAALPLVPGVLGMVLARQLTALDRQVTQAAGGMAELTEAVTELREAFQGTPWIRARALLGAGQHGFSPAQVTAVVTLADRLGRAVTSERDNAAEPDAELFAWLAGQVGLHHQDNLSRRVQAPDLLLLFRLLDLAAEVFGEGQPILAEVRNLRRLADLRPARAGLANGLATQQIGVNLAVSMRALLADELTAPGVGWQEQVRALARMVGQAKEATGPGRAVTRQDLRALRDGAEPVERAHQHLDARLDLNAAQVELLVRELLDGPATDEALRAVVGLLRTSEPDELSRLLRGSRLAERLIRRIPPNHRVRGALERFVADRFGSRVRPEDLSGGRHSRGAQRVFIPLRRPFRPNLISRQLSGVVLPADLFRLQHEHDGLVARARALLGASPPGLGDDRQAAAMALADRVRPSPSHATDGHRTDPERFAWLMRQTGAADRRQTFGFLNLADAVFGSGQADAAALIRLRQVANLDPARGDLANNPAPRQAMVNLVTALGHLLPAGVLPDGAAAAAEDYELAELIRALADRAVEASQVKLARGGPGQREPVTQDDLAELNLVDQHILRARRYLDAPQEPTAAAEAELTTAEKAELIDELLSGAATYDALRAILGLLEASDPAELTILIDGGGPAQHRALARSAGHRRMQRLITRIPPSHPLRAELNRFVTQRIGVRTRPEDMLDIGAGRQGGMPAHRPLGDRPFHLALITPALAGVDLATDLTRAQFDAAAAAIGQRPDDAVVRGLGLPASEQRIARAWLLGLRSAAARDADLRGHFDGTLTLSPHQLMRLISDALAGLSRVQAVAALEALSSDELSAVVAAGGGLRGLLEERIPNGALRLRAYQFLDDRFDPRGRVRPNVRPRPFAPSPPARAGAPAPERSFLTRQQLSRAAAAVGQSSEAAVARSLGLDTAERERALAWLARLRLAIDRQTRLQNYLSGDPGAELGKTEQRDLAEQALRGLAPWQALDLLNAADDDELAEMTQGGNLLQLAREQLPEGHPLRPRLDELLARRFDPGSDTVLPFQPARPFTLDLVSPALEGVPVSTGMTGRQMIRIGAEIIGFPDVLVDLPQLPPVPLARARWWAQHVAEPARLVQQAEDYLNGDPDARPDLRQLITGLLGARYARFQAARLVGLLTDDQLADLDSGGELRAALTRAFPAADPVRPSLDGVLRQRFDENGQVRRRHPAGAEFRPDSLVAGLDRQAGEELTPEDLRQIAREFGGREETDILADLELPPVELARARWWVRAVREAMRDLVLSHETGNPAFDLSVEDQTLLIPELLSLPDPAGSAAVRVLLTRDDDDELVALADLFDDGLAAFRLIVPHRVDPKDQLIPRYPALVFRPSMIAEELADLELTQPADDGQLSVIADRFQARWRVIIRQLAKLPPRQHSRALWWLADIRVQLRDLIERLADVEQLDEAEVADGSVRALFSGLLAIDRVLNFSYSQVAQEIRSAGHLASLAVVPPASQAQRLREAFTPPSGIADPDDESRLFTEVLPDEDEPFRAKLERRVRAVIQAHHQEVTTGRGEEEHDEPGALYEPEHVIRIAELVRQWINDVFGHLSGPGEALVWSEPGGPGNVFDLFDYSRWELANLEPEHVVEIARDQIYVHVLPELRELLNSHNAHPRHGGNLEPLDEAARILDDVIYGVLQDRAVLEQTLEMARGWEGLSRDTHIYIQRFRAGTPEERRPQLRDLAQTFIHEILHPRLRHELKPFPGAPLSWQEEHTIIEGFTSVLTEIVWEFVRHQLRDPSERRRILEIVDGADYDPQDTTDWPEPALIQRPGSYAEAMRVIRQVGIPNFYAAYFGGAGEMIGGPPPGARRSLLAPRGTAVAPVLSRPPSEIWSGSGSLPSSRQQSWPWQGSGSLPSSRQQSGNFPPSRQSSWPWPASGSLPPSRPLSGIFPPSGPMPGFGFPLFSETLTELTAEPGQERPFPPKKPSKRSAKPLSRRRTDEQPVTRPPSRRSTDEQPVTQPPRRQRQSRTPAALMMTKPPEQRRLPEQPEQIQIQTARPGTIPTSFRLPGGLSDTSYAPTEPGRAWVHHVRGDVLNLPVRVGAIVNAAHGDIRSRGGVSAHGAGGISGKIQDRGGPRLAEEIFAIQRRNPAGIETGQAVSTSAPNMNAEYVIHAVPPNFRSVGDTPPNRRLLAETYRNALALADSLGLTSVAFPILAGDIFRAADMTAEDMEQMALDALRGADTNVRDVYLVRFRSGPRATLPDATRPALPSASAATSVLSPELSRGPIPPIQRPVPPSVTHTVEEIESPLLGLPVQAIVNPTDPTLLGRTGLSGEILSLGGDTLREEIEQIYPMGVGRGEAVVTTAPDIAAERLIHVAVPDFTWGDQAANLAELSGAYRAAVTLADQLGLDTIAVPLPRSGDPRNGGVPVGELHRAVRDALARTPTTFLRIVYLVQETAGVQAPAIQPPQRPAGALSALARLITRALRASTLPPPSNVPARAADTVPELRYDRAQRKAGRAEFSRLAGESYAELIRQLGITAVNVPGDGDCFFNSLISLYERQPERLSRLLGGRAPTAAGLRDWLADGLRDDFALGEDSQYAGFFHGAVGGSQRDQQAVRDYVVATVRARRHWNSRIGDNIPAVFALMAGVPLTLVGREVHHLGPADQPPEHYIAYTGNHYMGARGPANTPIRTAAEVRPVADRVHAGLPGRPEPVPAATLDRYRSIYRQEFLRLRGEFVRWLGVPHPEAETDPRIGDAVGSAANAVSYLETHAYRPDRGVRRRGGRDGRPPRQGLGDAARRNRQWRRALAAS